MLCLSEVWGKDTHCLLPLGGTPRLGQSEHKNHCPAVLPCHRLWYFSYHVLLEYNFQKIIKVGGRECMPAPGSLSMKILVLSVDLLNGLSGFLHRMVPNIREALMRKRKMVLFYPAKPQNISTI